jgi:hypothetical protein
MAGMRHDFRNRRNPGATGDCPLLPKSGSIFAVTVIADFLILDFGRFQQYGTLQTNHCQIAPN